MLNPLFAVRENPPTLTAWSYRSLKPLREFSDCKGVCAFRKGTAIACRANADLRDILT
jgi:hypothetical protein